MPPVQLAMRLSTVRHVYQSAAVWLLNALVAFIVLNTALFVVVQMRAQLAPARDPVTTTYGIAWTKARYPDMEEGDVRDLLRETWSLQLEHEPYTGFRERPGGGRWVNVDGNGFRLSEHQGPWPLSAEYFNVFVFGGSTTFSYGLPDHQTVPSHLQRVLARARLPREPKVYNFGRGFYFSSQERVLYERLLTAGHVPDMAVFIDGMNEFYFVDDNPRFSGRLALFLEASELAKRLPMIRLFLPAGRAPSGGSLARVSALAREAVREEQMFASSSAVPPVDLGQAIERYIRNKRLTEAVSSAHEVAVVFVWQPIPSYRSERKAGANDGGRHAWAGSGYARMAARRAQEVGLGESLVWCADLEQDREADYVDAFHYSSEMAARLARCIVDEAASRGGWRS